MEREKVLPESDASSTSTPTDTLLERLLWPYATTWSNMAFSCCMYLAATRSREPQKMRTGRNTVLLPGPLVTTTDTLIEVTNEAAGPNGKEQNDTEADSTSYCKPEQADESP